MRLPERPETIDDLSSHLDSGELRETRSLEFKREFPSNRSLAKQLAGFAVEGGVLVIGVAEDASGFQIAPFNCEGARERVEQVARDIPNPPVQIESHILPTESAGDGVLWVAIPASTAMLHQVDGKYYERGDTQTRPMRDSDVADRMRLRADRENPISADLDAAMQREEPGNTQWQGRTCIVARPIGASEEEFYRSTQSRDDWESLAYALCQPVGMLPPTPNWYWGILKSNVDAISHLGQLYSFRDIEFRENGAFCLLSYCPDWLQDRQRDVFPYSALLACRETLQLVKQVQARTGERRAWDFACSVSNVQGRTARTSVHRKFHPAWYIPQIPRDSYRSMALGVSSQQFECDPRGVIAELLGRFIAECGLEFDEELPPSIFPESVG